MIRQPVRMAVFLATAVATSVVGAETRPAQPSGNAMSILKARCLACHGKDAKGGLDLRTRVTALKGGTRGAALVPGKSAASLLYRVLSGAAQPSMPQGSHLTQAEIRTLKAWIDSGAVWTQRDAATGGQRDGQKGPRWAFVKPARPAVPPTKRGGWVRNPIDAFILAELEKNGLTPSPEADRRTLLRRVTLDLIGLPPAPDEIAAFLADRSPGAYEKVVRRLLASPHYGERWAQHWLDVVRFGETNGFELDADRPQAWRYRDWVVRSLNADKPYDRFLTEQLAGDELDPHDFELRVATGFLRAGPRHVVGGNADPAVDRQEWLTEAVNGVGAAVLGLTVGCARCHDHKFDPIPQKDYYRLQAFFAATDSKDYQPPDPGAQEAYDNAIKALKDRQKPLQEQIAAIEKPYREQVRQEKLAKLDREYAEALAVEDKKRTPEQRKLASEAQGLLKVSWDEVLAVLNPDDRERRAALRRRIHAIDLEAPEPPRMAPGVAEVLSPVPASHVLKRGDVHALGEPVGPGFPTALVETVSSPAAECGVPAGSGRRTALARWLTQPDHPLTARVIVNRLWQHHFGRGIVATPNDFGKNGRPPTHPQLLDWLATELPRRSWSLKAIHEWMVTSATYRQASTANLQSAIRNPNSVDPDNRLLWRMNRRRLDAEALRDSVLAAAGTLTMDMGGPPVRVPLEPEVYDQIFTEAEPDNLWPVTPDVRQHTRRSLYLLRKRNVRLPMLAVFDWPDMMTPCAARGESVHSLQALTLMNSDFMFSQSQALARRVRSAGVPARMIERLFALTLGRLPRPDEARATERFLRDQIALVRARMARGEPVVRQEGLPPGTDPAAAAAWVDLCLAALNMNEFTYLK